MRMTYKINGHHIYTIEELLPFLYRFKIGVGRWRYAFNGPWVQETCDFVVMRVINAIDEPRDISTVGEKVNVKEAI